MDIFYPIQFIADWLTKNILNIEVNTYLYSAINFFIYDTVKIFILLIVIIFTVSIIRSFIPPEKIKNLLANKHTYWGNFLASLLGTITPFCSCSAIPLFLGFLKAGVPLGVTFSFLISSPMVNEVAVVMLLGIFGWKVAVIYIISGLIIANLAGIIIGHLNLSHLIEPFATSPTSINNIPLQKTTWSDRLIEAKIYVWDIIKKVWLYIILGIALGAWIHGYVPTDFLTSYLGSNNWYSVPMAVVIGIPLYSNAAGIIPLVGTLTEKGVSLGTSLAFMMSVTALSLPEFIILKKVMKTKLIIIFASIVGLGILFTGFLFNIVLWNK